MARGISLLALLALSACVKAGAGCLAYEIQRPDMPPLGTDALSEWVAVTDSAMTGACR